MKETRSRPEFKRPYCEACKNIPRIRGRWTQLHCRDCKYPARSFSVYLVVRLMQHYTELEEKMLLLHKQQSVLLKMYYEFVNLHAKEILSDSPDAEATPGKPQAD